MRRSTLFGVLRISCGTPFRRGKYPDVILPLTVLRRIDCVLAPTKEKVLETHGKFKGKLDNLDPQLRKASRFAFYNTSKYNFDKLLDDAPNLAANLRAYINGFSENMREVLEMFDFPNTIAKLDEYGLLFLVMERFASKDIDLHPDKVSNHEMGYIFEELVRRFNEALDENPGEHFTPREVIRLMVFLVIMVDLGIIKQKQIIRTVCDPCNGSGGMLTISKEQIHADQSQRRGSPVRAGVPAGDVRAVQGGPVHGVGGRARRRQHQVRQHALEMATGRPALRLPIRQSALRQGMEDGPEGRRGGGGAGLRGPVRRGPAAHQRRPTALPATHALAA